MTHRASRYLLLGSVNSTCMINFEVLVFTYFCVCTYEYSIPVQLSKTADFSSALTAIVTILTMVEVERIEDNASLYGCFISGHPYGHEYPSRVVLLVGGIDWRMKKL